MEVIWGKKDLFWFIYWEGIIYYGRKVIGGIKKKNRIGILVFRKIWEEN